MKFIKLTTARQFENLKKDNLIIVKWSYAYEKHHPKTNKIMAYNIYQNKKSHNEIICRLKGNVYFNWRMYLENKSNAEEVWLIEEEIC